jgi:hypothetical protein
MSTQGPKRLLDYGDDLDGLLRGALHAERTEPDDDARLARIGQGLSLAVTTGAPPAAPPNVNVKPAGWLATKGPFVVLAAAVIGGFAVIGMTGREPAPVARPVLPPATLSVAPPPAEPPIATISPADLPSAPAESFAPKPVQRSATAAGPSEGDEIALLARAHDALQGEPAKSLALCREHEAKFASGHFGQEREAVAIEALVKLGRRAEAQRRWSAFRDRFPTSSHRVHLESLFSTAPSAP